MTDTTYDEQAESAARARASRGSTTSTLSRIVKYTSVRIIALLFTVTVGVYLTILIANMGGEVDNIRRGTIRENIALGVSANPEMRQMTVSERSQLISELVRLEEERLGLNRPFLLRSFGFLSNAMTLNLGMAESMSSDTGSKQVRLIILERLPNTLLFFAVANVLLFFIGVFLALILSRRYGTFIDKFVIAFVPTSAAPAWFYGLFLILIFAAFMGVLPFGGMVAAPPPPNRLDYAFSVMRHLILPVSAIMLSLLFLTIYNWRTFFLIYSSEDYVEMAKAKGLSSREIERRYILRPTLPTIITSFALTLIGLWTGAIVLETVFNWPGLGRALFQAIGLYDTPVIVGSTVIYAYLLAFTVFTLDLMYAIVDPRVKVGGEGRRA
jgi:peptide/nickel transport system permease protein